MIQYSLGMTVMYGVTKYSVNVILSMTVILFSYKYYIKKYKNSNSILIFTKFL